MRINLNLFCSISVRMCRTGNWFYKHNPCLRQLFFFYFHNKGRVSVRVISKDLQTIALLAMKFHFQKSNERERERIPFLDPLCTTFCCAPRDLPRACATVSLCFYHHTGPHTAKRSRKEPLPRLKSFVLFVLDVTRGWILFNSLPVALWLAPSVAAVTKRLPKLL